MLSRYFRTICTLMAVFAISSPILGAELFVGVASTDVSPEEPASLAGQNHLRISKGIESPLTTNVVVVESHDGEESLDLAIMVSCDIAIIPADLLTLVREEVSKQLPDLDTAKIFLFATHTHTAPEVRLGKREIPKEGVIQVDEYRDFFAKKTANAIVKAWKGRAPGSVTWGLSHAMVANNRRVVYADGSAKMYGPTDGPTFRGLEGYADHDIGTLFFWNKADKLVAIAVNVSCPSQEVESRSFVNADFWHPVRESLQERYGADLCVLAMCGAAGDQSPHLMYRKTAEERMRRLRGLERMDEIARRIVRAVDEAYEVVKDDRHADVPVMHKVKTIQLPMRLKETGPKPMHEMELHVLRIGDAVVCTNSFELFTEYGLRIKARSKAVQTFVVQLCCKHSSYLPTAVATQGGGYSVDRGVGPEGGQALVDKTVEVIDTMWSESK